MGGGGVFCPNVSPLRWYGIHYTAILNHYPRPLPYSMLSTCYVPRSCKYLNKVSTASQSKSKIHSPKWPFVITMQTSIALPDIWYCNTHKEPWDNTNMPSLHEQQLIHTQAVNVLANHQFAKRVPSRQRIIGWQFILICIPKGPRDNRSLSEINILIEDIRNYCFFIYLNA